MNILSTSHKLFIIVALSIVTIPVSAQSPSTTVPPSHALFLYKLTPPRKTFPQDITPSEAKLMQDHAAYWRGLLGQERIIVFGPVADPGGTYGIAVILATNEAEARELVTNDPIIKANIGFKFDVFAMPRAEAVPHT
jgi:uncharacterized protein